MTIIELERELLQLGISDDLYSIMTGGLPNEKLCIVKEDKWQVYYSERGNKSGLKIFETETEALAFCAGLGYGVDDTLPVAKFPLLSFEVYDQPFIKAIEEY